MSGPLIQNFPADLLRDIFQRCLPPFKYQGSITFELLDPPYTLAKVCRHWRSVCLSTPLLWVDLPTVFTDGPLSDSLKFFTQWSDNLALSFPCDICLCLDHLHYHEVPDATVTENFRQIQPAFSRVRTLDLHANAQMLRAISRHAGQFSCLRVLKIYMIDQAYRPIPRLDFHPKVTSLTLRCRKSVDVSLSLLKCVEPMWPGITKFDGTYLPASSLRDILTMAPLLERLTFRNAQPGILSDSISSPLTHTHLKMMYFTKSRKWVGQPGVPDLSGIHLPALEDFFVHHPLPTTMPSTFLSFLEHTQGSLRNLHIGGVFESSYDQQMMYGLCPRLETLTMVHANDESLKPLTLTRASGNMCPNLRHLTLASFKLDSNLDYKTLWLDELTKCRFSSLNGLNVLNGCVPLETLTIVVTKSSNFLRFRSLLGLNAPEILSRDHYSGAHRILTQLQEYVNPNSVCFLDDLGIIPILKKLAEKKSGYPGFQYPHDGARIMYETITPLLDEMRVKPRWKSEADLGFKKKFEKFVFRSVR